MKRRTTIEFWEEEQIWKATEPASDRELIGHGDTPAAAIANYGDLLDDVLFESEADAEAPTQEAVADD